MSGVLNKSDLPEKGDALAGRDTPVRVVGNHQVTGNPMCGPVPVGMSTALFGMGCFWGVERLFWQQPGIYTTAAGFAGGQTANPTYEEVCTGQTGHNEVVQLVFDPSRLPYTELLRLFWESHDPTQGMRQGADRGSQYRSGIYTCTDAQRAMAESTRDVFQQALHARSLGEITTEILPASEFYFAEDYHQQYLHKNPGGYCSLRGTGASCVLNLAEAGA
jgi:peptide-methionine (S)-S-oxide reductase